MYFDWNVIITAILDYIIIPIIIAIGAAILYVLKSRFDKIAKSVVAKNEISSMEKKNNIRKELLATIDGYVEAAVASNMQLADSMKEAGQKLTEEQIAELNNSAKTLVLNSLPPSIMEEDGVLLELIGGKDRLDAIIKAMMEKHVYLYKLKKAQGKPTTPTPTKQSNNTRRIFSI